MSLDIMSEDQEPKAAEAAPEPARSGDDKPSGQDEGRDRGGDRPSGASSARKRGGSREGDGGRPESKEKDGGAEGGGSRGGRGSGRGPGRGRRGGAAKKQPRVTGFDPKELGKKAWQLYLADIAEEGMVLVDDKDARKLAVRSFELAKVFLEERARLAPLPEKEDDDD